MHGRKGRVSSVLLGGFGLGLALLMIYTLVFEGTGGCAPTEASDGQLDVAVFFLERDEWRIFARGVAACVDDKCGLGRLVSEEDDAIIVETPKQRRKVRFGRQAVRGEGQVRGELQRLAELPTPPIAVIGSSNTVLTAALARQLEEHRKKARPVGGCPILLVPWATSVFLMDLYPGRILRFCSNNRREAGLLVDALKSRPGRPGPRRVFLALEPLDPYSVELGEFFREEIGRAFPRAEFLGLQDGTPSAARPRLAGISTIPSAIEQRRAKAIWRAVTEGPGDETWVVLPMQLEPALRMLAVLNGASPGRHDADLRPLIVICGDAVGQTTLAALANQLVFPVWSVSTASDHSATQRLEGDIREQAEIIASLLIALDRPGDAPTPDALLSVLKAPGGDGPPAPFGRPLAFTQSGEREGYEPGEVLTLRPDSPTVFVHDVGRRLEPRPVDSGSPP
jgi:hypothetical protein